VTLRLRFDDFSRATRAHTLLQATAQTRIVLRVARELLAASVPVIRERGLTMVGIAVSNLADDLPLQLALPLDPADTELLDAVLDEIRDRFGPTAVTRAVLLGRRGLEMPLLPD
jgi:DNA polymerase-4